MVGDGVAGPPNVRIDLASACARAAFLTLPWRHCGGLGALAPTIVPP